MQTDFSYIPIDLQTVSPDEKMSFDVFHRTLDGRMEMYCAKGNCADHELYEKIKNSINHYLYINRSNLPAYTYYLQENINRVLENENAPLEKRVKYAYSAITYTSKNIFENPVKDDIIKFKTIIGIIFNNVLDDDDALKDLIKLSNSDFTLLNHSINVGFIGMGLAKKIFGAEQKKILAEIAAGLFLHDIGKLAISKEILLKKGKLTSAEWAIMKKHPDTGCKILRDLGMLSGEMEKILLQHHERYDGSGYPAGLKDKDIHIYAKICSFADSYDALTSKRPYRVNCPPFDAIRKLKKELFDNYEPEFYSCFLDLFRGIQ